MTDNNDTDILIVGAGPVGLFLATECARRGIKARIVESKPALSVHSKALAIFPRTLEIFDMAGVVEPFVEIANRVTSIHVTSHEHKLAKMAFEPQTTIYPYIAMVPQNITESLLAQKLSDYGRNIEFNTRFVTAEEDANGVKVTIEKDGVQQELHATYVVGCDGAHSTVRQLLGLSFEGGEYKDQFMLADIHVEGSINKEELLLCPHEDGPLAIFPISDSHCRVVATVNETSGDTPDLDMVKRLIAERASHDIKPVDLIWSSYFHIHHRHVSTLRQGRFFIAGDAAHVHSPIGGQGMNTGLQDVWNLIWKLDLNLRGIGGEELLDSYTEERMPVIKHVIHITDFLTRAMASRNELVQSMRNVMLPLVSKLTPFQNALVDTMSELGIKYDRSPIVDGPGEHYFDSSLRGGEGIKSRYILLMGDQLEEPIVKKTEELVNQWQDRLELRRTAGYAMLLVRPDGYLAYVENDGDNNQTLKNINNMMQYQPELT